MGVGLLGYGVSLVMFVLPLHWLGSFRTGAYFSTALFIGAAIGIFRTSIIDIAIRSTAKKRKYRYCGGVSV